MSIHSSYVAIGRHQILININESDAKKLGLNYIMMPIPAHTMLIAI